ncbi:tRNA glutamyl-Q(34) synthetase GluQRS [Phaeocystidibacter luteus]|uniref:Glutamyl-Q tRNA(Asp) synthetase n=1 Tax=Phaeocystidibacter luteus TaxID=911197 RepID=A0A6N6REW7_9FLAO|nr:tRNA glutamyl-Q(34) synthetase GluQRS [Phaeocystidibacter luteus]KAB2808624.1 tRNA glutamyl-Q(34) synthetase GluQRS [Phaeocystidibacter luteus]
MSGAKPRFRFAPSPTGELHMGNFATAVLAWLQARSMNGTFILRIEDNDTQRSKQEYADQIMRDMEWLGLDWDEGPFYQSKRTDLYRDALSKLEKADLIYPCFCSRKDLQALASAPHGISSEGPDYPGFCRDLSKEEVAAAREEKDPSFRFRLPHRSYSFTDLICGKQEYPPGYGGDFVVKRADGMWAYQLACTVDDLDMGITHVLRGSDLLDSTPRQLALTDVLGGTAPSYAHSPLWMGEDGHRLSKRNGAKSIRELRESGMSADDVLGKIGVLSGLMDEYGSASLQELRDQFDLSRIGSKHVDYIP